MHDLEEHLPKSSFDEYAALCLAIHQRLVHSNLSSHVVWEIIEFQKLSGDVFFPPERELLLTLLTNAADRVVVTAVALSERHKKTLNFGLLVKFLERNVRPDSKSVIAQRLARVKLEERRLGLLGRADRARNELIAHFNAKEALSTVGDGRLFIEEVLSLQSEAQDIFDLLRVDSAIGYACQAATVRQMLRLLADAYGERVKGPAKSGLQEMRAPGNVLPSAISPWKLGGVT